MSESEQTVVEATARIDWRKLLLPSLFIMVLPTVTAFLLDQWFGSLPLMTLAAIVICFPTATFFVIRVALQEMDRVIALVAPPAPEPTEANALPLEGEAAADRADVAAVAEVLPVATLAPAAPEPENRVEGSPTP